VKGWTAPALGALLGCSSEAHASEIGSELRASDSVRPGSLESAPAPRDAGRGALFSMHRSVRSTGFWWPTVVFERGSTHITGVRSVDETRFGLSLAYRSRTLSPHLRALVSPSLGAYHNLAGMLGGGLRAHFDLAGVSLSYGVGLSIETRLRDSLWLSYATPIEIGASLYRGSSAEHFVFVGARRTLAGALINSYLLDPNGYDNEGYVERLAELRDENAWQLFVSIAFGRRVE
jgi:hypothetical protein